MDKILVAVAWADIYALAALRTLKRLAWVLAALVIILLARRHRK